MGDWITIDESAASQPILLRGIPVTQPDSYGRTAARKGGWFQVAAILSGLWRVTSWSASILGHLVVMIVLVGIVVTHNKVKELLVQVSLNKGNQGDHGKLLAAAKEGTSAEIDSPKKREDRSEAPEERKRAPMEEEAPPPSEKPKEPTSPIGAGETAKTSENASDAKDAGKQIETDPTSATRSRRAGDLAKLRRGGEKRIVTVGGSYDHVERVLDALAIPHTRIDHDELGAVDLSDCLVLLVNCHSAYGHSGSSESTADQAKEESNRVAKRIVEAERKLANAEKGDNRRLMRDLQIELSMLRQSKQYWDRLAESRENAGAAIDGIRRFVDRGGYVFTSDWGLTLLEKAFPDFVAYGGTVGPTEVKIAAKSIREEARLLDEVFVKPVKPGSTVAAPDLRWEIDSGSYLIRIKSNRVRVVVDSAQLSNYHSVAVVFAPTDTSGRVLHVLSHFAKQGDSYGEYALQNLLLNFILERVEKK